MDLYERLYDKAIISDLKIKFEDEEGIIFGTKRSAHWILIPKQVTSEIAYLAGAIAGDGSLLKSKRKNVRYPRVRITITGGDRTYLEFLNKLFIRSFAAGGQIRKDTRKVSCYTLMINHRLIWLYFKKILELDKKKLRIPKQIANRDMFRFFLAGFFDTDGYCTRNGIFGTMMSAKNTTFLRELRFYSDEFYSLEFHSVRLNILTTKDKIFERAYTNLKKSNGRRFIKIVPLKNKKYGPAQDRTGDLRCFLSTGNNSMQM